MCLFKFICFLWCRNLMMYPYKEFSLQIADKERPVIQNHPDSLR